MINFSRFLLLVCFCIAIQTISVAQCGLDVFVANDQSGSIDDLENSQGRDFITTLMEELYPWGTGASESRVAIAQWDDTHSWTQYDFPIAGQNFTSHLSDVISHQNSARSQSGGTDPYDALI